MYFQISLNLSASRIIIVEVYRYWLEWCWTVLLSPVGVRKMMSRRKLWSLNPFGIFCWVHKMCFQIWLNLSASRIVIVEVYRF